MNYATKVDYDLVQKEIMKSVIDIKLIPGEECFVQNRLLVLDLILQKNEVQIAKIPRRLRIWRLKDEGNKKTAKDLTIEITKESQCWEEWSKNIFKVAKRVCGIGRGDQKPKTSW